MHSTINAAFLTLVLAGFASAEHPNLAFPNFEESNENGEGLRHGFLGFKDGTAVLIEVKESDLAKHTAKPVDNKINEFIYAVNRHCRAIGYAAGLPNFEESIDDKGERRFGVIAFKKGAVDSAKMNADTIGKTDGWRAGNFADVIRSFNTEAQKPPYNAAGGFPNFEHDVGKQKEDMYEVILIKKDKGFQGVVANDLLKGFSGAPQASTKNLAIALHRWSLDGQDSKLIYLENEAETKRTLSAILASKLDILIQEEKISEQYSGKVLDEKFITIDWLGFAKSKSLVHRVKAEKLLLNKGSTTAEITDVALRWIPKTKTLNIELNVNVSCKFDGTVSLEVPAGKHIENFAGKIRSSVNLTTILKHENLVMVVTKAADVRQVKVEIYDFTFSAELLKPFNGIVQKSVNDRIRDSVPELEKRINEEANAKVLNKNVIQYLPTFVKGGK